jgi:hypothetical protein
VITAVEERARQRLEERLVPEMVDTGANEDLVRKAFDERFQEVKLQALREDYPHVLAPEGSFLPQWLPLRLCL